jgi:hypothetical protein
MSLDNLNDEFYYWRLCDELTVFQATLLAVGVSPSSSEGAYCENWPVHDRPHGYEAAKMAISNALLNGVIDGTLVPHFEHDINGNTIGHIERSVDIVASTVSVESVVNFLADRGVTSGFFARKAKPSPDYLDPKHPRYAPKLAAAIHAWLAVTHPVSKSPKQALDKWLREHAAEFGLTGDDGNPVNQAIEDCSKVANWNSTGGAPKTPG